MGKDQLDTMFTLLHKIDREQGVILEKLNTVHENSAWLESRVDKLEEKTQALGWFKHAKNLTLWIAALLGGISACVSIIGKLK